VQVENLVSTIGKELDTDMPASVVAYNKTEKSRKQHSRPTDRQWHISDWH